MGSATRAVIPLSADSISRGLDDELKGSAFAVIDGVDGRAHHIRLQRPRRDRRRRARRDRGGSATRVA